MMIDDGDIIHVPPVRHTQFAFLKSCPSSEFERTHVVQIIIIKIIIIIIIHIIN